MEVLAACATDDGKSFSKRTFSDAYRFVIYRIGENEYEWIKAVTNPARPEDPDEAPPDDQAAIVVKLLQKEKINVVIGKRHAPEGRLVDCFVPVRVDHQAIGAGIYAIMTNLFDVTRELNKTDRCVIEIE